MSAQAILEIKQDMLTALDQNNMEAFADLDSLLTELEGGNTPSDLPDDVPVIDADGVASIPVEPKAPEPERGIGEMAIGGLEAAGAVASGAILGLPAQVAGTVAGIGNSIADGTFGTNEGAQQAEQDAARYVEGMQQYAYQPRTEAGKDYLETVGEAGQILESVPAMQAAQLGTISRAVNIPQIVGDDIAGSIDAVKTISRNANTEVPSNFEGFDGGANNKSFGENISDAARGDQKSIDELVDSAEIDDEVMTDANFLGVELPLRAGLKTDSKMNQAAGVLGQRFGGDLKKTEAERNKQLRSDISEIMQNAGASDIDVSSYKVRQSLDSSVKRYRDESATVFKEVNSALKGSLIKPKRLIATLERLKKEAPLFSDVDEKLLQGAKEGLTFKDFDIARKAVYGGSKKLVDNSRWADMSDYAKAELYNPMREDYMDHASLVGSMQGKNDLVPKLKAANANHQKFRALEDEIIKTFGSGDKGSGSIATKLKTAISSSSKSGDIKNMQGINDLLTRVPADLRKEVVMSSIRDISGTKAANNPSGTFEFNDFAKTWGGISRRPLIAKMVRDNIGPESFKLLESIHTVSEKMASLNHPDNKAIGGATTQDLTEGMKKQPVYARIFEKAGNVASAAIGITTAAKTGSIMGGAAAGGYARGIGKKLQKSDTELMNRAATLLGSDEFHKAIMSKSLTPKAKAAKISKMPNFKQWFKVAGVGEPEIWLLAALTGDDDDDK